MIKAAIGAIGFPLFLPTGLMMTVRSQDKALIGALFPANSPEILAVSDPEQDFNGREIQLDQAIVLALETIR